MVSERDGASVQGETISFDTKALCAGVIGNVNVFSNYEHPASVSAVATQFTRCLDIFALCSEWKHKFMFIYHARVLN